MEDKKQDMKVWPIQENEITNDDIIKLNIPVNIKNKLTFDKIDHLE